MKKCFLSMFFLLWAIFSNAQTANSGEQQKVQETIIKLFDGIAELNIPKIRLHSVKDFLLLESGSVWNVDSLVNALDRYKNTGLKRTNKLSFIQTDIKGNMAWVAYNNTAEMSLNGQQRIVNWLESAVLVKENGEWKVKMLHSTKLQPRAK